MNSARRASGVVQCRVSGDLRRLDRVLCDGLYDLVGELALLRLPQAGAIESGQQHRGREHERAAECNRPATEQANQAIHA